ncbi:MAG TPA: porin [Thermoanaerobaculia bacterium]|jgi:phosphate-selective porin OprO/OprP|nr:porin [Thermoanaerobaculia bacterium]
MTYGLRFARLNHHRISETAMKHVVVALSFALLTLPSAWAQESDQEPAKPAVEERLDELDQKIRILDRKQELEKEAAAEKAKTAGQVTASKDGFSLKSADGNFVLKLRGYTQFDGRFFQSDDQKPATDTFTLRRVRPIFEGTVYKIFDFRIMPDFGGGQSVLQDAYLEGRFSPAFKVRAGKFKPPVGLERLQSGSDLLFVERAFPTNLVPNRDLGVQLAGDLAGGIATYAVGIFNGVVDGNSADGDTNDEKDYAARVFFQPFVKGNGPLKNLGFGVAGGTGNQEGTAAAPNLPTFRTPGQQTFFSYRSDGTAANTVIADGRRTRFSPQAYLYTGPFGLLAEHVTSKQAVRRGADARNLEHKAWQVAASWVLTGGEPSYRSVNPKKVFDPAAHTWGAFEIAARYHKQELDDVTFPTYANLASSASSAEAWAVGFNWYLNKNLRLLFDYEDTSFEGGAAAGDREDEKIFFSRFQIAF